MPAIDGRARRPAPPVWSPRQRLAAAIAVTVLLVVLLVWGINRIVGGGRHPVAFPPVCTVSTDVGQFSLDPNQAADASTIAAVGQRLGVPNHAVTVALATALQESDLVNLTHGDRDSVGLFQQRPSEGWGTPTELHDPIYAATAFYDALTNVPGWETLAVTEAAQDVQRSATPLAYANQAPEGRSLAIALTGEVAAGFVCHFEPASSSPSSGWRSALAQQIGSLAPGIPVSFSNGWVLVSWLVAHADQEGFTRVSFAGRTWTPSSGVWKVGGPNDGAVHVS